VDIDNNTTIPDQDPEALIEQTLAAAAACAHAEDWSQAAQLYRSVLPLMGDEAGPRRAGVLTCLAEMEISQENLEEGLILLQQALHTFPRHEGALRRAMDLTVRMKRHALSMEFRRRLLALSIEEDERTAHLRALVYDGTGLIIEALGALRGRELRDFDVLDRLRAAHEAAGDPLKATDVMVTQAEEIAGPHERAGAMVPRTFVRIARGARRVRSRSTKPRSRTTRRSGGRSKPLSGCWSSGGIGRSWRRRTVVRPSGWKKRAPSRSLLRCWDGLRS
jgi:hypothetical protein